MKTFEEMQDYLDEVAVKYYAFDKVIILKYKNFFDFFKKELEHEGFGLHKAADIKKAIGLHFERGEENYYLNEFFPANHMYYFKNYKEVF